MRSPKSNLRTIWITRRGRKTSKIRDVIFGPSLLAAGTGFFLSFHSVPSVIKFTTMMKQILLFFASIILLLLCFPTQGQGQWILSDDSIGAVACFNVGNQNLCVGTETGSVYRVANSKGNWVATPIYSNSGGYTIAAFAGIGTCLFAGIATPSEIGTVVRSTDNGADWSEALPLGNEDPVLTFAITGADLYAGQSEGGGISLSTDSGVAWKSLDSGLTNLSVQALALNDFELLAGTQDGIFLTTNDGANWQKSDAGLTNMDVLTIASAGSTLFAGTNGAGIFVSIDNGTSWSAANNGLTNSTVNALATNGTTIFAGTDDGVFISTNNGTIWMDVASNMANPHIIALKVYDSSLFAGTLNPGLWSIPLSEIKGTNIVAMGSRSIESLVQAFPNPFLDKTTITISPSEDGVATITIVNLLGQQVAQLFDGELTAGPHSLTWDASNAEPGSYWCIARMGDRTEQIALSVKR
jgi:photosystem II stability/assembly factor-like uncharacterized protein